MKRNIKDIIIYLIKSILAGIMIAIGGKCINIPQNIDSIKILSNVSFSLIFQIFSALIFMLVYILVYLRIYAEVKVLLKAYLFLYPIN